MSKIDSSSCCLEGCGEVGDSRTSSRCSSPLLSTREAYRLRRQRDALLLKRHLIRDHRSSKPLAEDLSDRVRVGPEGAGRQDIALLHLDKVGAGVGSGNGGLDGLEVVVREAASEEDCNGHLALLRGRRGVASKTRRRGNAYLTGKQSRQLGNSNRGVETAVDDCGFPC